jgi:hypothetical protein
MLLLSGDLYFFSFAIAIAISERLGSGTSDRAVFLST